MNAVKTINEGTWVVEESTALRTLTIAEGASLAPSEGKSLTMSVNGIGRGPKPGTYKGDIFINIADKLMLQPSGLFRRGKPKEYRTAILIDDGRYVPEKSAPSVFRGGTVTDSAIVGGFISAADESLSGIIVTGRSEYTIENVMIDLEGDGPNDFIGLGSGITCTGDSKVTINNSSIHLNGVTRCTINACGNSVTTLNNCRISNESPANELVPTWMIALSGSNRATMHCDYATIYYNNCHIRSNGWGALSLDGGRRVRMYVKDSTIEVTGPRANGYGAFSIGNAFISYDNCLCNVQGYPILMCGAEGRCDSEITNGSIINSMQFGAMIFRDRGSTLTVNKGTIINSASSTFVVKGSYTHLDIDNAVLNPANGVILQLMDNDMPDMRLGRYLVPVGEVDKPISGRDLTVATPKEDVFMSVSNADLCGNFYNSTTDLKANCREEPPDVNLAQMPGMPEMDEDDAFGPPALPPGMKIDRTIRQGVKNLELKFTHTKITGIISAATATYKDDVSQIDPSNLMELSNITQTAHEAVNNGVIVSFEKDCIWTVTDTSYLTALTIGRGTLIKAPEGKGKTVVMTVDGVETPIVPGTYTGKITLKIV